MTPFDFPPKSHVCPLAHRAVVHFAGADAAQFLHAQLTANVLDLTPHHWRLAGYCSAKGRLLASGLLWCDPAGYHWLVAKDLVAGLVQRLRMFVLRAKVDIMAGDEMVLGVGTPAEGARQTASEDASENASEAASVSPGVDANVGVMDAATLLHLPAIAHWQRAFAVLKAGQPMPWNERWAPGQAQSWLNKWHWLEVRSGLVLIEAATQDQFVPQMVNLEALGGVDFKKGCYPGQEVVARSQYLGKLKRRTRLAHSAQSQLAHAGDDVVALPTQAPIGRVVSAALSPEGQLDCLIEAPLSAWPEGLALAKAPQYALEPLELPYVLPDNEVFVRPRL